MVVTDASAGAILAACWCFLKSPCYHTVRFGQERLFATGFGLLLLIDLVGRVASGPSFRWWVGPARARLSAFPASGGSEMGTETSTL